VAGVVARTAAAPDVVPGTGIAVGDLGELGDVEVTARDSGRAEDDVRRQRSLDDVDADLLHLGLDDRLGVRAHGVRSRPSPTELGREAGARPGSAAAGS